MGHALLLHMLLLIFHIVVSLGAGAGAGVEAAGYPAQNASVPGPPYFPAMFVFGDSLTDSGNNNKLLTLIKANKPPYGKDFPLGPTGRFCNGPLSTDYIASRLGLPFPPPYLSMSSVDDILQGVTFASSGAGILNSTSIQLGQVIPLSQQMSYFRTARNALQQKLGVEGATSMIAKSLFYISMGSNDYIANYLLAGPLKSPLQLQFTPPQFVELLQTNLEKHMLELYNLGARKFAILGLSALGCVPYELFLHGSRHGQCLESINDLSKGYNAALQKRVVNLQSSLPDAHFTYLNTYDQLRNIINDPSSYGFEHSTSACCGSGPYRAIPCGVKRRRKVCDDASKYVFWDTVHPSAAFNKIIAKTFCEGSVPNAYPFNLKQLGAIS